MDADRNYNPSRICWKDDLYDPTLTLFGSKPCKRLKGNRFLAQGLQIYLQNRILRKRLGKSEMYNALIPSLIWTVDEERIGWELRLGIKGNILGFASWENQAGLLALTNAMKDPQALHSAQGLLDATYFDSLKPQSENNANLLFNA